MGCLMDFLMEFVFEFIIELVLEVYAKLMMLIMPDHKFDKRLRKRIEKGIVVFSAVLFLVAIIGFFMFLDPTSTIKTVGGIYVVCSAGYNGSADYCGDYLPHYQGNKNKKMN